MKPAFELSPEQRRAVTREGQDVCVVAGPGSGKTRVLTERFAWLVEQRDVDPGRILAVTFTDKAAIEIRKRLVKRFSRRAETREAVERAWVSTIHGFCARLLRENAIAAGLDPNFTQLEQAPAERMAREAAEEALDELFAQQPAEMRRLMEALDLSTTDGERTTDLASALLEIHEAMRVSGSKGITEPPVGADWFSEARVAAQELAGTPLADWCARFLALDTDVLTRAHFEVLAAFDVNLNKMRHPAAKRLKQEIAPQLEAQWLQEWYADLRALLKTALERVASAYRARKRREACLDFTDLEEFAVKLLETNTRVRQETAERFDEVLMDELQDTNRVQWRLIELVKQRLFAVGDINQSIYGFRHADPEVFAEYRSRLLAAGSHIDELQDNYRSRPQILDTVAHVLDKAEGIEPRELHAKGTFTPSAGPVVERLFATGDDATRIEGEMVAARIQKWKAAGTFDYKNVAVLVRTFSAAEPIEEAFKRAGIPFLVSSGRGFLEARETRDVMALLAAAVNTYDEIPLFGVLRGPLCGWSDEDLYRLGSDGRRRVLEERFGRLRQMAGLVPPDQLVAQVLDECGYWEGLTDRERANIDKLLGWLRREFRNRPRPLAEMLDDLEALRKSRSTADAAPPEAGDVVRVMTIHAAKGLEFPVVFVSGLHKGADNSTPPMLLSVDLGLGAKWLNPVTDKGASDPVHKELRDREKARDKAEENRLLYVAMTRAEQRLILTHAESRRKAEWLNVVPATAIEPFAVEAAQAAAAAEVETYLPTPLAPAQYDSAASITSVALFAACPRRYYLGRYLGLEPEPDGPGTGAITLGLEVHAVLAGQTVDSPEAHALAARFSQSIWGERAARAERLENEFDVLFELEGLILRGQIDLWFEEAGELILVDYKTDRNTGSAEAYALQLRLYAIALERFVGRLPDCAVLFYVRPEETIEVDLSPAAMAEAKLAVGQLRDAQIRQLFPLEPGEQCKKCSFVGGLCPVGKQEGETTRNSIFGPPSSSLVLASGGF